MRAIAALVGACAAVLSAADCVFDFPEQGYRYDLTSLTDATYSYIYNSSNSQQKYFFRMCGNIPATYCGHAQTPTASYWSTMMGRTCLLNYGYASPIGATTLSEDPTVGLSLSISGDSCNDPYGDYLSTTYNLQCGQTTNGQPLEVIRMTKTTCTLTFTITTPAACPTRLVKVVPALGGGWIAVIVLVVLFVAYLGGGMFYKSYKLGASGVEAIPNIDFWRRVWSYIVFAFTCGRVKAGYTAAPNEDPYYEAFSGEIQ